MTKVEQPAIAVDSKTASSMRAAAQEGDDGSISEMVGDGTGSAKATLLALFWRRDVHVRLAAVACLGCLFPFVGMHAPTRAATGPDASAGVRYWKFDTIDEYYRDRTGSLRILGVENGRRLTLDPSTSAVGHASGRPAGIVNRVFGQITVEPVALGDGRSLSTELPGVGSCADAASSDPTLIKYDGNGAAESFYVIARRTPAETVYQVRSGAEDCRDAGGGERLARTFGTPLTGDVFPLAKDAFLLCGFYDGIIVRLAAPPTETLSFGDDLFLIPEKAVAGQLRRAGPSVTRRYKVFLAAITNARRVVQTALATS